MIYINVLFAKFYLGIAVRQLHKNECCNLKILSVLFGLHRDFF